MILAASMWCTISRPTSANDPHRGELDRRITPTVSPSVYDSSPRLDGFGYCSRFDDAAESWAVFEDFPLPLRA